MWKSLFVILALVCLVASAPQNSPPEKYEAVMKKI